jgi:hypothetical protein
MRFRFIAVDRSLMAPTAHRSFAYRIRSLRLATAQWR